MNSHPNSHATNARTRRTLRRRIGRGLFAAFGAAIIAAGAYAFFSGSGFNDSAQASVTTLGAPTNVVAKADNGSSSTGPSPVTITWSAPSSGPTPTGYKVVRDDGSTQVTLSCNASPCTDSSVPNGTYTYHVTSLLGSSWTSSAADSNQIMVQNQANPTLSLAQSSAPSAGSGTAGSAISASSITATLAASSGANAGGTITFYYYQQATAPNPCNATGRTTIGTAAVSGNGSYNPNVGFTPSVVGNYWLYATYGGDSNNNPANSICPPGAAQEIVVSMANPTLTASAPASDTTGTPIAASSITSVLASTSGSNASGTITWKYFQQAAAPTTCTSGGTTIGTASVSGNGSYNSNAGFTPSVAGNYWVYAGYSGDSNNNGAASTCGSGMTRIVVGQAPAITSANSTTFISGSAGSFNITATGSPTNSISNANFAGCTKSTLPASISFTDNGNNTATISGTPAFADDGTYTLCLNAANGVGSPATQTFTLTIATTVTQNSWTSGGYTLTVPPHVTSFIFTLNGAGGGGAATGSGMAGGAAGGSVSGTVHLPDSSTATQFTFVVGAGGATGSGVNGGLGGAGGTGCAAGGKGGTDHINGLGGGGGGAATCIYKTSGVPIAIAGGGGGGSDKAGGAGSGGPTGAPGTSGAANSGGGGGSSAGPTGGTGGTTGGTNGGINGGAGGTGGSPSSTGNNDGGGGGGGGYASGGGGGFANSSASGGGGGGSGFSSGDGTFSVSNVTVGTGSSGGTAGNKGADGSVSFTGIGLVDPPADPPPTTTDTTTTDTTTDTTTTDATTTDTTTTDTTTTDTTTTATTTTDATTTDATTTDQTSTDTTTTDATTTSGATQASATSTEGLSTPRQVLFFGVLGGSVLGLVALLTMPIPRRRRARRRKVG